MNLEKKVQFDNTLYYINKNINNNNIISDFNTDINVQLNLLKQLFIKFINEKNTQQYHIKMIKMQTQVLNNLLYKKFDIDSIIPTEKKDPFHLLSTFIMIYNYKCSNDKLLLSIVDNIFSYIESLLKVYESGTNNTTDYLLSIFGMHNIFKKLKFDLYTFENNNELYHQLIKNLELNFKLIQHC